MTKPRFNRILFSLFFFGAIQSCAVEQVPQAKLAKVKKASSSHHEVTAYFGNPLGGYNASLLGTNKFPIGTMGSKNIDYAMLAAKFGVQSIRTNDGKREADVCKVYQGDAVTTSPSVPFDNVKCKAATGSPVDVTWEVTNNNYANPSNYKWKDLHHALSAMKNAGLKNIIFRAGDSWNGVNKIKSDPARAIYAKVAAKIASHINAGFDSSSLPSGITSSTFNIQSLQTWLEIEGTRFSRETPSDYFTLFDKVVTEMNAKGYTSIPVGSPVVVTDQVLSDTNTKIGYLLDYPGSNIYDVLHSSDTHFAKDFTSSVSKRVDMLGFQYFGYSYSRLAPDGSQLYPAVPDTSCLNVRLSDFSKWYARASQIQSNNLFGSGTSSKPIHIGAWATGLEDDCLLADPQLQMKEIMRDRANMSYVAGTLIMMQQTLGNIKEASYYGTYGEGVGLFAFVDSSNQMEIRPAAWSFWAHKQMIGSTIVKTSTCNGGSCYDNNEIVAQQNSPIAVLATRDTQGNYHALVVNHASYNGTENYEFKVEGLRANYTYYYKIIIPPSYSSITPHRISTSTHTLDGGSSSSLTGVYYSSETTINSYISSKATSLSGSFTTDSTGSYSFGINGINNHYYHLYKISTSPVD